MLMLTSGIQKPSYTRALEKALVEIVLQNHVNVWIPSFPHSAAVVMMGAEPYDLELSLVENLEKVLLPELVTAVSNASEAYIEELERMAQRCHAWTVQWGLPRITIQHPNRSRVKMILTYAST